MKRRLLISGLLLVLAACEGRAQTTATIDAWTAAVIVGDWATATTMMTGNTFDWQERAQGSHRLAPWTAAELVAGPQPWAGAGEEAIIRWSRPYPKADMRVRCTRIVVTEAGIQA